VNTPTLFTRHSLHWRTVDLRPNFLQRGRELVSHTDTLLLVKTRLFTSEEKQRQPASKANAAAHQVRRLFSSGFPAGFGPASSKLVCVLWPSMHVGKPPTWSPADCRSSHAACFSLIEKGRGDGFETHTTSSGSAVDRVCNHS